MTVKMWPVLPKDHPLNGLSLIEQALIDAPEETHIVIATVNGRRITIDADTGENTPTARIVNIEVITGNAEKQGKKLLAEARKARTGSAELPFEDPDGPGPE